MRTPRFRRLALWGGALALSLTSTLAIAQDGAPPTGPPVTNPKTNQNSPVKGGEPTKTSDVLPGIPATARDPAPPGTRGVRVDTPAVTVTTRAAQRPVPNAGRIFTAEGVVTRLDRAGKNVDGELERFAFDPSQDWSSYVNRGVQGVLEKDAERPRTNVDIKAANEKQHEDSPRSPMVMEMAITKRTYVYTFARDLDGIDQYDMARRLGRSGIPRLPVLPWARSQRRPRRSGQGDELHQHPGRLVRRGPLSRALRGT